MRWSKTTKPPLNKKEIFGPNFFVLPNEFQVTKKIKKTEISVFSSETDKNSGNLKKE